MNDYEKITTDILIVGAGMVGATLACLIAENDGDVRITLLDHKPAEPQIDLNTIDPRVVALSEQSKNILEHVQCWPTIQKLRACPYTKMTVWDADGTGRIHFRCEDIALDQLGHIVEHKVILSALHSRLKKHKHITQIRPCQVDDLMSSEHGPEVWLSQRTAPNENPKKKRIASSLVIAADGAHSDIRHQAQFPVREWDCDQTAIVTTLYCEKPHQHTAWQRFTENGPLAYLPLHASETDNPVSIVWSLDTPVAEEKMQLSKSAFCKDAGLAMENTLGEVRDCDDRFAFPLHQRMASRYFRDGVVLVGDAAHSIHPLAGQGANLGLSDANVLAQEIHRARERTIPLDHDVILQRYEQRRQPENMAALMAMAAFKRGFGSNAMDLRYLRNLGLNACNRVDVIRRLFTHIASGDTREAQTIGK